MARPGREAAPPAPQRSDWLWPLAATILGVVSVFHEQLRSGFDRLQVYPQDPLFQNWTLEHVWSWLRGTPLAADLWTPPFFHPTPGALALSDPQFGLQIFYGPARLLGAAPHLAYTLAAMAALATTFVAFHWLLRGVLALPMRGATIGAYLIAFGSPRAVTLNHPHQFVQFPSALALGAALLALDERRAPRTRQLAAATVAPAVALQLVANVYLGPLVGMLLVAFAVILGCSREGRRRIATLGARGALAVTTGALVATLIVAPLAAPFAAANQATGGPTAAEIALYEPRPASWLNPGAEHLVSPWLERALGLERVAPVQWAHRLGVGLFTTALVLAGAVLSWREPRLRWLGGATICLALATLRIDGWGSLWSIGAQELDPLRALRVISRVGLAALPSAGIALALAWQHLERRSSRAVLALATVAVLAEQVQIQPSFELEPRRQRARQIAAAIPADCDSFYYSPVRLDLPARRPGARRDSADHQVDAMWAALAAGRPTLNGYSSHPPADWPLYPPVILRPEDVDDLRFRLGLWIDRRGLGDETVCWIRARILRRRVQEVEVERLGAFDEPRENPARQVNGPGRDAGVAADSSVGPDAAPP